MQSIDDSLVSPPQNLVFVDEVTVFVFAAEEQRDDGYIHLFSLLSLLEVEHFLLDVPSERCQTCPRSHEDHLFPSHSVSKGGFTQLCPDLSWNGYEILGN